jgi:hypothetical protein
MAPVPTTSPFLTLSLIEKLATREHIRQTHCLNASMDRNCLPTIVPQKSHRFVHWAIANIIDNPTRMVPCHRGASLCAQYQPVRTRKSVDIQVPTKAECSVPYPVRIVHGRRDPEKHRPGASASFSRSMLDAEVADDHIRSGARNCGCARSLTGSCHRR